jgi:hypothetical protein
VTGLNGSEATRLILQISNTAADINSCISAGRNSRNKISGIVELACKQTRAKRVYLKRESKSTKELRRNEENNKNFTSVGTAGSRSLGTPSRGPRRVLTKRKKLRIKDVQECPDDLFLIETNVMLAQIFKGYR